MKEKLKYLNVGCGNKFHSDWINIDMRSYTPDVISYNLLKGLPFPDESFEVVYHSQVLEHFPKEKAYDFMKECYRVLKKNGIIRVVVPDLENIVDEYKKFLKGNLENPGEEAEANYDWIMLEMYDQTVRNYSGGQMAEYLQQENMVNEQYVIDRIGYIGRSVRNNLQSGTRDTIKRNIKNLGLTGFAKKSMDHLMQKFIGVFCSKKYQIGHFRSGGEIHMWMYDRFSLSRLLKSVGFRDITIKNAFESNIPDWGLFELDVKDGLAYDPTSLFMEAKK